MFLLHMISSTLFLILPNSLISFFSGKKKVQIIRIFSFLSLEPLTVLWTPSILSIQGWHLARTDDMRFQTTQSLKSLGVQQRGKSLWTGMWKNGEEWPRPSKLAFWNTEREPCLKDLPSKTFPSGMWSIYLNGEHKELAFAKVIHCPNLPELRVFLRHGAYYVKPGQSWANSTNIFFWIHTLWYKLYVIRSSNIKVLDAQTSRIWCSPHSPNVAVTIS